MEKINFPLFIGSKNRLLFPMHKLVKNAYLFVEPQNFSDYQNLHGKRFKVINIEKNNQGFAYLCNYMLNFAEKKNFKYYVFCDDDVFGFKRKDKKPASLNEFYQKGVKICDEKNYSQLMMSFAGHNWYYKGKFKEKIGAWCCEINRTKNLKAVGGYDKELEIFNDWDISAVLILKGYTTACWYDYMFLHKMKSLKGGAMEIYKKQEKLKEAIKLLRIKYGKDCIREVKAHNQVEARFRWSLLKKGI